MSHLMRRKVNKELKDWTMDDLLTAASWQVMDHIIKGSLRDGVWSAINLALRWKAAQEDSATS